VIRFTGYRICCHTIYQERAFSLLATILDSHSVGLWLESKNMPNSYY
jgi:hypothetical protein